MTSERGDEPEKQNDPGTLDTSAGSSGDGSDGSSVEESVPSADSAMSDNAELNAGYGLLYRDLIGNEPDTGSVDVSARYQEISRRTIERLEAVFVLPPTLEKVFADSAGDCRLFVVSGQVGCGRLATCMGSALKLFDVERNRKIYLYKPQLLSLDELVSCSSSLPQSAAFIVNNFVSSKRGWEYLSDEHFAILIQTLRESNSFLFLVCEDDSGFPRVDGLQLLRIPAEKNPGFLRNVILKHLEYQAASDDRGDRFWESITKLIESCIEELSRTFSTPVQVKRLFDRLERGSSVGGRSADWILELAKEIVATDHDRSREWFRQLPKHLQFYGMVVQLFSGLSGTTIHHIYNLIEEYLLPKIPDLQLGRSVGIEDRYEQLHIMRSEEDHLSFEFVEYADEVERQINNFRMQLWDAIRATIVTWIGSHASHEDWWLRQQLGRAIGRLGIYDWPACCQLLDELSARPERAVAAVSGHILYAVVQQKGPNRNSERLGEINVLLRKWVLSKNVNQQWAVVAAIWRFYEPLLADERTAVVLEETEGLLELLTLQLFGGVESVPDGDVLRGLVRAIVEMFRIHPGRVVTLVARWIQGGLGESAASGGGREYGEGVRVGSGVAGDGVDPVSAGAAASDDSVASGQLLLRCVGLACAQSLFQCVQEHRFLSQRVHGELLRLVSPLVSTRLRSGPYELRESESQEMLDGVVRRLLETLEQWLSGSWISHVASAGVELAGVAGAEGAPAGLDSRDLKALKWESCLLKALIQALNRSSSIQRRALVDGLQNGWLLSDDVVLRRFAGALLARAAIVDGVPVDLPRPAENGDRHSAGLLLLDGSASVSEMGIISEVANVLTVQLSVQSALRTGFLGQLRLNSESEWLSNRTLFRSSSNSPRLLMPVLESLDPEDVHYILVLAAGPLIDVSDLDAEHSRTWVDRLGGRLVDRELTLGSSGSNRTVDQLASQVSQFVNRSKRVEAVQKVLEQARTLLAGSLAARSAESWTIRLKGFVPEGTTVDVPGIKRLISDCCRSLDEVPTDDAIVERGCLLGAALQWLASHDPEQAVQVLEGWSADFSSEDVSLAASYSHMLIRILANDLRWEPISAAALSAELPRSPLLRRLLKKDTAETQKADGKSLPISRLPDPVSRACFLRLGVLLVKFGSWNAIDDYFLWVRRWLYSPEWAERIENGQELLQVVEHCPPVWRRKMLQLLDRFGTANACWGDQSLSAPPAVARISERLRTQLLLGPRKRIDWSAHGGNTIVFVVDATDRRMMDIFRSLWKRCNVKSARKGLKAVAFRLGHTAPALLSSDRQPNALLLPAEYQASSLLIGPVLESLPVDMVSCAVLLTAHCPLDLDDVQQDWGDRGFFFFEGTQPKWAPRWAHVSDNTVKSADNVAMRSADNVAMKLYESLVAYVGRC